MSLLAPPEPDDGDDVERTEATWHPAMSRAVYARLLRLLFDRLPDDDGNGGTAGERAA